jgi:hypothetical protein
VVTRWTQRLLEAMRGPPRAPTDVIDPDDDWHANLIWFDRQTCLLFTHASTLFRADRARRRDPPPLLTVKTRFDA